MFEIIFAGVASACVIAVVAAFICRRYVTSLRQQLQEQRECTQGAEKDRHLRELELLAARASQQNVTNEQIENTRLKALEEGKRAGQASAENAMERRLLEREKEFASELAFEKKKAADDARETLRREQELQTKLFSLLITPYVKIYSDSVLWGETNIAESGYRYQLLVNGIPAFAPHEVIERQEKTHVFDEKIKQALIDGACTMAKTAASLYLGGSTQFAQIAEALVDDRKANKAKPAKKIATDPRSTA